MTISVEDVRHVAQLARLSFTREELTQMTEQLGVIIDSIGKVAELDLADVPPTTHVLDVTNVAGDDVPHQSLSPDEALKNAPQAEGGAFRVPQMRS